MPALAGIALAAGNIVADVRMAAANRNLGLAEREVQSYRSSVGVTAELLEAESWLARGALDARQYDVADRHAEEVRKLTAMAQPSPSRNIARGAAIEVHAQVLAARGERSEAIAFLKSELAANQGAIAIRIQKNINLLSLEGKPAPALDVTHSMGGKAQTLAALKGHPVLLFFWAHWCVDCKAEVPVLAHLMSTYGPRGLVLMGPTQHYGYIAGGEEASPEVESRYIDQVRTQFYAPLGAMPVPVSEANFQRYGSSTTPTIVLLDSAGIVRLYHPGAMRYEDLAAQIERVMGSPKSRS